MSGLVMEPRVQAPAALIADFSTYICSASGRQCEGSWDRGGAVLGLLGLGEEAVQMML